MTDPVAGDNNLSGWSILDVDRFVWSGTSKLTFGWSGTVSFSRWILLFIRVTQWLYFGPTSWVTSDAIPWATLNTIFITLMSHFDKIGVVFLDSGYNFNFWAPNSGHRFNFFWWTEYWIYRLLYVVFLQLGCNFGRQLFYVVFLQLKLIWILGRLDADTTFLSRSYNSDLNTGQIGCRFDFSMSFLQLRSGYWFLIHTGQTGCRYDFSISFLQLWSEYCSLHWIRLDARLWQAWGNVL